MLSYKEKAVLQSQVHCTCPKCQLYGNYCSLALLYPSQLNACKWHAYPSFLAESNLE